VVARVETSSARSSIREPPVFCRFALEERARAEGVTVVGPSGARDELYLRPDLRVERRLGNGTLELSQFDAEGFLTGRATHKRASDGAEVCWGVRYDRSGEGDLVGLWDSARGPARFELDAAHRLVGVDRNGSRESIELDPAGNVLSKHGLSRVELMEGNRLVATAEEEFVYDERQLLAGRRRRSDGRFTRYTYDSLNQLVRVEWRDATGTLVGEPWTADYDVLGRRVRFGRGKYQTELWWDGLRIAAEEELVVERGPDGSASTRRARLRIYGYPSLDALVPSGFVDYASRDAAPESGRVHYVFTDPTGLPLSIEDARGETVWWATGTHPYGDVEVHPSSRIDYAMRWPGHRLDAALGLFYNRFRDYDPTLARYLQTDPIGQRGGINVYAYCNNPLKEVDLLGLAGTHGQHTPNPAPDGDAASTTGHPHTEGPPADPRVPPHLTADGPPEVSRAVLVEAREAQRRAQAIHDTIEAETGVPFRATIAADGVEVVNGYGADRSPRGRSLAPDDAHLSGPAMVEHTRAMGEALHDDPNHYIRGAGANDRGVLGQANATHGERLVVRHHSATETPVDGVMPPVGVSRETCGDCRQWIRGHSEYTGTTNVVADPVHTRVFHGDGTVDVYDANGTRLRRISAGDDDSQESTRGRYEGIVW
jgi:RHS repeat-associated protein